MSDPLTVKMLKSEMINFGYSFLANNFPYILCLQGQNFKLYVFFVTSGFYYIALYMYKYTHCFIYVKINVYAHVHIKILTTFITVCFSVFTQ